MGDSPTTRTDINIKQIPTKETEARATSNSDELYEPTPSHLDSLSPHPLIRSVDGPDLNNYDDDTTNVFNAHAVPVPLRSKLDIPIPVTIGGSIVEYTVESKTFDIRFGIVAKREDNIIVVTENTRINSHISAIYGKFIVGAVPCALIFTFDNEYSWFREKYVSYKICIKPPTKATIMSGRRTRARKVLRVIGDDKSGAETRLKGVSTKRTELINKIVHLEKILGENKKSLDVIQKEEAWLTKRIHLRDVQNNLLLIRLNEGWEDEEDYMDNCHNEKVACI